MAPPTVLLAGHALVLCGLAALLRAPLTRLASRPRVWRAVACTNLSAMTLYLWHLPVLCALIAVQHDAGLDRPAVGTLGFALGTVALLAVFGSLVTLVVRVLWPLEHAPLPWWDAPARVTAASSACASSACASSACASCASSATSTAGARSTRHPVLATVLVASGTLLLAQCGLADLLTGEPLLPLAVLGAGLVLARGTRTDVCPSSPSDSPHRTDVLA